MTRFGWVAFVVVSIAGCGTTNEVECTRASDCASGMACIAGQCTDATTCVSSRQCPDLVCDTTLGTCVECVTASDCDAPLVCVDSVCGTAMVGIDSGADAGMDAFIGVDAFVGPRDVGVGDATHDAFTSRDSNIDGDALTFPDAFAFPDAYDFPDAVVLPDAYVIPDAFVPNDTSGCDPGRHFCGGMCVDTTSDPMNCSNCGIACPGGYTCIDSGCVCTTRCSGVCTDTTNDAAHCGSCGHACSPGEYCRESTCYRPPCGEGQTWCNGCTTISVDTTNCGGCGNVCPAAAPYCVGGTCVSTCPAPLQNTYGYSCRDIGSDPTACGASNGTCAADEVCATSWGVNNTSVAECVSSCPRGLTRCGRACVNTALDVLDCGSCGHACASGQVCSAGSCVACPAGTVSCGGACVSTATDTSNCGGCGNVCPDSARYCVGGTCAALCPAPLDASYYGYSCYDQNSDPSACGPSNAQCRADQVCQMTLATSGTRGAAECLAVCDPGMTTCGRACVNTQLNVLNCGSCGHACAPGEACANGVCSTCAAGERLCGPSCVDTSTDLNNCGGCGNVCPPSTHSCVAGSCVAACLPPLTNGYPYDGTCREIDSDPEGCGSNGNRCAADEVCELVPNDSGHPAAECMSACTGDLTACDRSCVNLQLSALHCGSCGHACAPGESCANGVCATCGAGQRLCGVSCVQTSTDTNNCGGCGNVCPSSTPYCIAGTCVSGCMPPLQSVYPYTGVCRDFDSDPMACGAAGSTCGSDQVCTMVLTTGQPPFGGTTRAQAECMQTCAEGLTRCNRSCVNPQLDVLNCGGCGHACAPGQFCSAGACTTCPAGTSSCGGTCTDTATDTTHCGTCGHACPSGQYCVHGSCSLGCPAPLSNPYPYNTCRESSDPNACGSTSCRGDQVCALVGTASGGARGVALCMAVCPSGLTQCGRSCVDPQLSVSNCGSCGHACASGEYCVDGVCAHAIAD